MMKWSVVLEYVGRLFVFFVFYKFIYNSVTLAAVKIDSQNMMPGTIVLFTTATYEETLKRSLKMKDQSYP